MRILHQQYLKNFIPYAASAFLVGIVGGFTSVLGPAFVKDIGIAYNNTAWTALSLAISSAACAPILGKISDAIGRRRTLLFGIIVYICGNVLTACATTLSFMIIARFVVGLGTATITPVAMSYILTEFPQEKLAKGFALYMLISSSAVIFGPTIGGVILEYFNWRILMWVCVAISLFIFLLCLNAKESKAVTYSKNTFKNFDYGGAVFVLIFFGLFLCLPTFLQNFGYTSIHFRVVLIGTLLSFLLLLYIEHHSTAPLLPKSFVKRKAFILSVIALFLTQGLMQANMTNLIVFVNYTQPNNTLISGYAISIMYLGMSVGAIAIGQFADKVEPKNVLTVSFSFTALSCIMMYFFQIQTSAIFLAATLGLLGFSLGGNATTFMKVVLADLPKEIAGTGTGVYGLFRDISAPFGVAVFVPLFTNQITKNMTSFSEAAASVSAMQTLAISELICVLIGIVVVRFLPNQIR